MQRVRVMHFFRVAVVYKMDMTFVVVGGFGSIKASLNSGCNENKMLER